MLAPFLQSLSCDGQFHPSARDWHRLNVVLRTPGAPANLGQLRTILRSVLVSSEAQGTTFDRRFDTFFRELPGLPVNIQTALEDVRELIDLPQPTGEERRDVFHDRLESEFDDVSTGRCWSVRPEWPGVIERDAFREMLQFTLEASDDLGAAIRRHFHGRHDRRHVIYVNHTPVESSRRLSPQQLLDYLSWWDEEVLEQLEPQQCVVLGVSFVVNDPIRFRYAVESIAGIPAHPFGDRFVFKFLPVLAELESDDIRTFFKRINMQRRADLPTQERAIEKILQDTHGEYDLVVRELEVLINKGFAKFADLGNDDSAKPETEDLGY